MEVINGITHFFTQSPSGELLITKTCNPAVISKLSGLDGKEEKHWKCDEDGKKLPKIKNHKWQDEEGNWHGNDKEYTPINKSIQELLTEPD